MRAFARSFSRSRITRRRWTARVTMGIVLAAALLAAGCVTVRPEERELLAEPEMTFGSDAEIQAHEQHVFSNREGSFGAGSVSGGGCGCN